MNNRITSIPAEYAGLTQAEIGARMGISRQRVSQIQRKLAGYCDRCGRKAAPNRALCAKHLKADRTRKAKAVTQ
jgi:uncharacterized OB-fold protein